MGYIGTFFKSFQGNTDSDINSILDMEELSNKQWEGISSKDKQILMESNKKTPDFVKKLMERLKGTRKRGLKKAFEEQFQKEPEQVYGNLENYRGIFSDERDER